LEVKEMKKVMAGLLTVALMASLAGCSLGGGKYSKTKKKVISAAEKVYEASEADKKQKKSMIKSFRPSDSMYEDGIYVELSGDDFEKFNMNMEAIEDPEEDLKNVTLFGKSEGKSGIGVYVIETTDKEIAQGIYDEFMDQIGSFGKKELKAKAKNSDLVYGIDDEKDDTYAVIAVSEDDNNQASAFYFNVSGNVVTIFVYSGTADSDLYESMYEYTDKAGLYDFEKLLDED
jgi:hypothetical protein